VFVSLGFLVSFLAVAARPAAAAPGHCATLAALGQLRSSPGGRVEGQISAQRVAVLDTAATRRGRWVRVLAADGSTGWIGEGTLRDAGPGAWTVDLPKGRRESPDADTGEYDPPVVSDEFPDTTLVPTGALRGLRGAARIGSLRRFPPTLPDVLQYVPWVLARGERRDAWFPTDLLAVACDGAAPTGLLRAPFPTARPPVPPLAGAGLLSWDAWTDSVKSEGGADSAFALGRHLWRIAPPAGSEAGFQSVDGYAETDSTWDPEACLSNGGWSGGQVECASRTGGWIVRAGGGIRLLTAVASAVPEPVRAEFADLDGDGRIEAVVEISTDYGDGTFQHLWVLDGRDGRISALGIGGVSGEPSAPEPVEAVWKVVPAARGNLLQVRTRQGRKTESVRWAWRDGRFAKVGKGK